MFFLILPLYCICFFGDEFAYHNVGLTAKQGPDIVEVEHHSNLDIFFVETY